MVKETISYTNAAQNTNRVGVTHGSPTRGPPACTMRSEAAFVNCVYTIKTTQYFRRFGIPHTIIFFYVRPATRPAITVVDFAITSLRVYGVKRASLHTFCEHGTHFVTASMQTLREKPILCDDCLWKPVVCIFFFHICHPGVFLLTHIICLLSVVHTIYSTMQTKIQGLIIQDVPGGMCQTSGGCSLC